MSVIQKTIGAAVAALFPKSQKAVSEKLSNEEFNEFANEAGEVQSRLDAQAEGNTREQADRQAAEAKVTALEAQVATLTASEKQLKDDLAAEAKKTADAEAQVTTLKAQVKEKDDYIQKLKAAVNPLAEEDASNAQGSEDYLTETDREARAAYAKK